MEVMQTIKEQMESVGFLVNEADFKEENVPEKMKDEGEIFVVPLNAFFEIADFRLETAHVLEFINSKTEAVKEWEESCIAVYRTLRWLKNVLESAIKEIESDVVDTVQAYPKEYLDFRVSTRTTYQYNTSPLYIEKSKELKDIETLLKQATENKMKGIGHTTDAEGMIIDPVEVKYTQVLTYSPKWV